jgi:hypothetical protein
MPINQLLAGSLTGMLLAGPGGSPPTQAAATLIERPYWIGEAGHTAIAARTPVRAASSAVESTPGWKLQLSANSRGLADLRAGWDGPGSLPIPASALARAIFYIESALACRPDDIAPPRLVPGGDGSIQVEWHTKRGELEFDIDGTGRMSIWIRNHLSGAEFDGGDEKALALFYRWAPWVASRGDHAPHVSPAPQMATFGFAA